MSDWKNIEQRQVDAKRGRRAVRQGAAVTGLGASAVLAGGALGSRPPSHLAGDFKYASNRYKQSRSAQAYGTTPAGQRIWMNPDAKNMFFPKGTQFSIEPGVGRLASARAASSMLSNKNKLALAMMAGGGAAVAGGVKTMMYGKMKERHAERKIAQMRKKRAQGVAKADSVSAFGVDHGADVSKAFREPKSKDMELLIPNWTGGLHPVVRGELRGYRVERKNRRKFATKTGLLGAGVGVVPGMMAGNPYAMLAGAGVGAAAGGALGYAGSKWGREFVPTTPEKPKKSKTANAT